MTALRPTRGPNIPGTNVPTEAVAERFHAGESIEELAADYGLRADWIEQAIRLEAAGPQWTQDLPTEEGLYWMFIPDQEYKYASADPILVDFDMEYQSVEWLGADLSTDLSSMPAEIWWIGPLDEPEPPEVKP